MSLFKINLCHVLLKTLLTFMQYCFFNSACDKLHTCPLRHLKLKIYTEKHVLRQGLNIGTGIFCYLWIFFNIFGSALLKVRFPRVNCLTYFTTSFNLMMIWGASLAHRDWYNVWETLSRFQTDTYTHTQFFTLFSCRS